MDKNLLQELIVQKEMEISNLKGSLLSGETEGLRSQVEALKWEKNFHWELGQRAYRKVEFNQLNYVHGDIAQAANTEEESKIHKEHNKKREEIYERLMPLLHQLAPLEARERNIENRIKELKKERKKLKKKLKKAKSGQKSELDEFDRMISRLNRDPE